MRQKLFCRGDHFMRVFQTVHSLHPRKGGPARTVPRLSEKLVQCGLCVQLLSTRVHPNAPALVPEAKKVTTEFATHSSGLGRSLQFWRLLASHLQTIGVEIVHVHGLWRATSLLSVLASIYFDLPLIVTPRSMLERWALNHHKWRKKFAWHTYQRRALASAQVLHATSTKEAQNLRSLGLSQPLAVIPNGVPVPNRYKQQASSGSNKALFLSRLHPVKGLPHLIDAWAAVRPTGWELCIAGPDEDDHRATIERQTKERGIASEVTFIGHVSEDKKWDLYHDADLFVLPTHSEGFGVVVAEALASGLPVITTKGAPWKELKTHGCGWWTDIGTEPLAEALADATSRSDAERLAMGRRGRMLVEQNYTWPRVAEQMHEVYRWVLGEGTRPDCVSIPASQEAP